MARPFLFCSKGNNIYDGRINAVNSGIDIILNTSLLLQLNNEKHLILETIFAFLQIKCYHIVIKIDKASF